MQPPFLDEADLLVRGDRPIVVRPDLEGELVRPGGPRPIGSMLEEESADSLTAVGFEDRHPDRGDAVGRKSEVEVADDAPRVFDHEPREPRRIRELGGRRRPGAGSSHVALRHDAFRAYAD